MAKRKAKCKPQINVPSLDQALEILRSGKHPYYHPCSCCNKPCSTPTKSFWEKRVKEYGSVALVYEKYRCRDCRKSAKEEKKSAYKVEADNRPVHQPGAYVHIPEGSVGVSVFEEGKFLGTTIYAIGL